MHPGRFVGGEPVRYPTSRQTCDIGLGSPLEWAIEVKMARAYGDNGKPDDTWIKDLLSPYPEDRSALTDAHKLRDSAFSCHRAVLVYGFDYASKPLEAIFVALETLLRAQLSVGSRVHASFAEPGPSGPPARDRRCMGGLVEPLDRYRRDGRRALTITRRERLAMADRSSSRSRESGAGEAPPRPRRQSAAPRGARRCGAPPPRTPHRRLRPHCRAILGARRAGSGSRPPPTRCRRAGSARCGWRSSGPWSAPCTPRARVHRAGREARAAGHLGGGS